MVLVHLVVWVPCLQSLKSCSVQETPYTNNREGGFLLSWQIKGNYFECAVDQCIFSYTVEAVFIIPVLCLGVICIFVVSTTMLWLSSLSGTISHVAVLPFFLPFSCCVTTSVALKSLFVMLSLRY